MEVNETVLVEVRGGVAQIVLNRPDRLNAWNTEMDVAFKAAIEKVEQDPEVRVVIVTGSGRAFCPGADTSRLEEVAAGKGPDPWARPTVLGLASLNKPTIAAVNGACAGIGFLIALLCDVRFAAEDARISSAYVRRGLPAEYGMSWLLTRIIGLGHAADLLLSGRIITGSEGVALGLMNRSYPSAELSPATEDYASAMAANCSPAAMRMVKRQMYSDLESTFEGSVHYAASLLDRANKGDDFHEGLRSYVEKRLPRFRGLE